MGVFARYTKRIYSCSFGCGGGDGIKSETTILLLFSRWFKTIDNDYIIECSIINWMSSIYVQCFINLSFVFSLNFWQKLSSFYLYSLETDNVLNGFVVNLVRSAAMYQNENYKEHNKIGSVLTRFLPCLNVYIQERWTYYTLFFI